MNVQYDFFPFNQFAFVFLNMTLAWRWESKIELLNIAGVMYPVLGKKHIQPKIDLISSVFWILNHTEVL